MLLDELVKWAQILQGIGIVAAVIFGLVQWKQQNNIAKAANSQSLAAQAADFNFKIVETDQNLKAWYSFGRFQKPEPYQLERYREFLTQWLILHENIFHQNQKGLLDDSVYKSWNADLEYTVRTHNFAMLNQPVEKLFPGLYGEHIRALQAKHPSSAHQPRSDG